MDSDEIDTAYWYQRGLADGRRSKPRMFRYTRNAGIHVDGEAPPYWSREDEITNGRAYLDGWLAGEELGIDGGF